MKIRAQDKSVSACIEKLHHIVCGEGGAIFDPSLALEVRGAELSYHLIRKARDQQRMVSLPVSSMPQIDHFQFQLDRDGRLRILSHSELASEHQLNVMEQSLELFNLLEKVNQFAKNSPSVQLQQFPDLLGLLLQGGNGADLVAPAQESEEALKIAAFWQGRMFYELESNANRSLPLLEFMNHHLFANNFKYEFRSEDTHIQLHHKNLVAGQTFARYEIMDALQTCVVYGFVDESAYFLQSQVFEMALVDEINLKISSQAVCSYQSDLPDWDSPPYYQNSFMYRSRVLYGSSGAVLPYAIVPPGDHILPFREAVSAQFAEIERHYELKAGVINNEDMFWRYANRLYDENRRYYIELLDVLKKTDLSKLVKGSTVPGQLKSLLEKQRRILKSFSKCLQ